MKSFTTTNTNRAFNRRTLLLQGSAVTLAVLAHHPAQANAEQFSRRFTLVRIGDTEAKVLAALEVSPNNVQRTNTLGITKTVMEFKATDQRYTITLVADVVVSKHQETVKSWLS
jgi:hypothetical protein